MGDVALLIYAGKDQFSSFVPIMCVISNVHLGGIIGHFSSSAPQQAHCSNTLLDCRY
jgi:hypothetical protein